VLRGEPCQLSRKKVPLIYNVCHAGIFDEKKGKKVANIFSGEKFLNERRTEAPGSDVCHQIDSVCFETPSRIGSERDYYGLSILQERKNIFSLPLKTPCMANII
jgi:hypothetical protein